MTEPTWKERTVQAIESLDKDTFIVPDIKPYFPERGDNNISATLCALVSEGYIYRTGKRAHLSKKQHYVEYTTSKALSLSGGDSTAMRGWDPRDIEKVTTKKLLSEHEKQIECLKKKLIAQRKENKKLRDIIALIDPNQLLNIVLNMNGK
jgi:hypothetical protein